MMTTHGSGKETGRAERWRGGGRKIARHFAWNTKSDSGKDSGQELTDLGRGASSTPPNLPESLPWPVYKQDYLKIKYLTN